MPPQPRRGRKAQTSTTYAGPRPVRELKGFPKVLLQSGDSSEVVFAISNDELGYYDTKDNWLVEPGKFQVWICKDSASGKPADFELAGTK